MFTSLGGPLSTQECSPLLVVLFQRFKFNRELSFRIRKRGEMANLKNCSLNLLVRFKYNLVKVIFGWTSTKIVQKDKCPFLKILLLICFQYKLVKVILGRTFTKIVQVILIVWKRLQPGGFRKGAKWQIQNTIPMKELVQFHDNYIEIFLQ